MRQVLHSIRDWLRDWVLEHAVGKKARLWLGATAFSEASFFPVPPDVLLAPMVVADRKQWIRLAMLTTLWSTLGAVLGYGIGMFLFDTVGQRLVDLYHLQDEMRAIGETFSTYSFIAIFGAAFTPIPFKVFTVAGGLFGINFIIFMLATVLGRGARFFIVAYVLRRYGAQVGDVLYRYFNTFSLLFVAIILLISISLL